MAKLHILFLHFSSLCFVSSAYTLPDKYFINCGSTHNFTDSRRTFVGDATAISFSLSANTSFVVNTTNPSSELYQTARVFESQSSYKLDITENGTYLLRFHFFPPDLPNTLFDVSASGSTLFHNFTVQSNGISAVVKEFLLVIGFKPRKHSFAFANAVEVFLCPDGFIPETAIQVSQAGLGSNGAYMDLVSLVIQTVHRINVGDANCKYP